MVMKSLSGKIAAFGIIVCLITGLFFSIYSIIQQRQYLIEQKINKTKSSLILIHETIQKEINQLKADTSFLASTPPILGIKRATENNGIDPKDGSSLELWKKRLSVIFEEMLYAKGKYFQIRYIGKHNNGRELVRVNRYNEKIVKVKEQDLQSKEENEYFKGVMNVLGNEVYLSDFSLNKEYGRVVLPEQIVLRSAVPVMSVHNEKFGFVIINMNYTEIFKSLVIDSSVGDEFLIVNNNKVMMEKTKDKYIKTVFDIKNHHFEKYYNVIKSHTNTRNILLNDEIVFELDGRIIIEKKIFYDVLRPNEHLSLIYSIDKSSLLNGLDEIIQRNIILLVLILIVAVIISLVFSSYLSLPIRKLKDIVQNIREGKDITSNTFDIEVKSNDEIGLIATTLAKMSHELVENNMQLTIKQQALDASAIVVETDTKGKITFVNDKFVEISKFPRKELLGQDHRILNSGHHPKDFFKDMWTTIKSGRVWKGEIKNKAKDETYYWVDTTIYPYLRSDGSIEKFVAIRFDITEKKKNLDDLMIAKEKAAKALDSKTNFLANMSHEIRTPLNGIIGFTSLLIDKKLDKETLSQVEQIKNCSESLLVVINDILDLSKIEAGKLHIENVAFNLKKVIQSTVYIFSTTLSNKDVNLNLRIDQNVPVNIFGDPLRLRQVIINLVGNAIKFTKNGEITIHVSVDSFKDNKYILKYSVKDTGIGISSDAREKLFSAFEQADASTTREFGGTGLGLSICKKIIELQGGSIWVESTIGVGSEFIFTLEATEARESEIIDRDALDQKINITQKDNSNTFSNYNVLLVEDNIVNQKVALGFLKNYGFSNIDIADDGVKAVECCQNKRYDIIFMDIQMPKMDGYSTTKVLREKLNSKAYIIGLSANVFPEDKTKGLEFGMNDYIGKPLSKESLDTAIRKSLNDPNKIAS